MLLKSKISLIKKIISKNLITLGYEFENDLRVRLQVKNIEDERAPLADETFSMFWGDLHTDYGRNYSVEFYKKF